MKYLFLFFIFLSLNSFANDPFQGGVGDFFEPGEDPGDIFRENPAQRHTDWTNFFDKDSWKTKTRAGEDRIKKREEARKTSAGYNASKEETQKNIEDDPNWVLIVDGRNGGLGSPYMASYITPAVPSKRIKWEVGEGASDFKIVNWSGNYAHCEFWWDRKPYKTYYTIKIWKYIGDDVENQTSGESNLPLTDTGRQPKPPRYDDLGMEQSNDLMDEYDPYGPSEQQTPEDTTYIAGFELEAYEQLQSAITDQITGFGSQQYATLGDLEYAQYQQMEGDIRREGIQEDIYETLSSIELLLMLAGENNTDIDIDIEGPGDGTLPGDDLGGGEPGDPPPVIETPEITNETTDPVGLGDGGVTIDVSQFENLLKLTPGNQPIGFTLYLSELNGVPGMNLEDYFVDFTAEPIASWVGFFRAAIAGIMYLVFMLWAIRILRTMEN